MKGRWCVWSACQPLRGHCVLYMRAHMFDDAPHLRGGVISVVKMRIVRDGIEGLSCHWHAKAPEMRIDHVPLARTKTDIARRGAAGAGFYAVS